MATMAMEALQLADSRGHTAVVDILRPLTKSIVRALGKEAQPIKPGQSKTRRRQMRPARSYEAQACKALQKLGKPTQQSGVGP